MAEVHVAGEDRATVRGQRAADREVVAADQPLALGVLDRRARGGRRDGAISIRLSIDNLPAGSRDEDRARDVVLSNRLRDRLIGAEFSRHV